MTIYTSYKYVFINKKVFYFSAFYFYISQHHLEKLHANLKRLEITITSALIDFLKPSDVKFNKLKKYNVSFKTFLHIAIFGKHIVQN